MQIVKSPEVLEMRGSSDKCKVPCERFAELYCFSRRCPTLHPLSVVRGCLSGPASVVNSESSKISLPRMQKILGHISLRSVEWPTG